MLSTAGARILRKQTRYTAYSLLDWIMILLQLLQPIEAIAKMHFISSKHFSATTTSIVKIWVKYTIIKYRLSVQEQRSSTAVCGGGGDTTSDNDWDIYFVVSPVAFAEVEDESLEDELSGLRELGVDDGHHGGVHVGKDGRGTLSLEHRPRQQTSETRTQKLK